MKLEIVERKRAEQALHQANDELEPNRFWSERRN
jgi:hypothetical protein